MSVVATVKNVCLTLELYQYVAARGQTRKTGDLFIRLDASVMTRSASVDGTSVFIQLSVLLLGVQGGPAKVRPTYIFLVTFGT